MFGHIFLVVEENHTHSQVIGNSAMPYLNSLTTQYGLATQYYANAYPSIGDYFIDLNRKLSSHAPLFEGDWLEALDQDILIACSEISQRPSINTRAPCA